MSAKSRWIVCLLLLSACVERFELNESLDGEPWLVIDGTITDADETHYVKLSYASRTLRVFDGSTISGAEVYISDGNDNRAVLTETADPGTYQTDSTTFRGRVGETYTLHITTPDGREYASLTETIRPAPPVDSVYFALESVIRKDVFDREEEVWGLRFFLNTGDGDDRPGYYRWTYTETYKFNFPTDLFFVCYQTVSPPDLFIGSTQDLSANQLRGQPLHFVEKQGRRLQMRYSVLVRQQYLSERAYTFWERIQTQQKNVGSVFDPPPAPIAGNMYNVNDDKEVVLGYFVTAGVAERRIFVDRSDVPMEPGGVVGCCSECEGMVPPSYCYKCLTLPGTTLDPPSFW